MPEEKPVAHLNIFLVKEGIRTPTQIIKEDDCKDPIEVPIPHFGTGLLYVKNLPGKSPKWASIFKNAIDLGSIGKSTYVSAAFLVEVDERQFVVAFGLGGRFLIRDDVYEERFGLLAALNSVDKDSFRCIDKQSLDTIDSHTRIQSGHETSADQFGIDVEQDMLKAIVGTPQNQLLGTRMTGTDSLSVSVHMELSDLPSLLSQYKDKFEQDLSATDYQWVSNIHTVRKSSSVTRELDDALLEKIRTGDHTNLWLAIPEMIDWEFVKGFVYSNQRKILHSDITLNDFLSTLTAPESITFEALKRHRVCCADADHNPIFKSWPIHQCIYAEIDYEYNKYVLNAGKWYRVSSDFVSTTNDAFGRIVRSSLSLPEYCGGGEGKYNSDVAGSYPESFVLFDDRNKISHGGGHGQVEVCDLFSKDKQLIHVKIYGRSNVFSHLFAQGFVSGHLLQLDSEFRRKIRAKLPKQFTGLVSIDKRPAEGEFTIVYSIISESKGDDLCLPFFSRVNLNNTAKTLKGFGYNVELLKINVNETHAKTKICATAGRHK